MKQNSIHNKKDLLLISAKKALDKMDFSNTISNIETALKKNPENDQAWYLMSLACLKMKKLQDAQKFIETALGLNQNSAEFWSILAEIYLLQNNLENSLKAVERSIKIDPHHLSSLKTLGNIYLNDMRFDLALRSFEKALSIDENDVIACWGVCFSLYNLKETKSMWTFLQKILDKKDQLKLINTMYAHYLFEVEGNVLESIDLLKAEIKLDPDSCHAYNLLSHLYCSIGEVEQAKEYQLLQISKFSNQKIAFDNLMMNLNYIPSVTYKELLHHANEYQKVIYPEYSAKEFGFQDFPHIDFKKNNGALRVGFVSGDFRKHVVYSWIKNLFANLRNENIEVFAYCNNEVDIATKMLMLETPNWYDIVNLNDYECSNLIKEHKIDILIDLSGHTALNRLGVFAQKPAPVQVSWLGQSSPIGIKNIDYTISDSHFQGTNESMTYIQKIYIMPEYFSCFNPPEQDISIKEAPCMKNNFITFGSYNNLVKINSSVIKTWSEILIRTPNSKLKLKNKLFQNEDFKKYFLDKFAKNNIGLERLILEKHDSNKLDYLKAYNEIDIALDPFPHGGGTTTHDLLWMGVPLITLFGNKMSARSSASVLSVMKQNELISYTEEEYIAKAVNLAQDYNRINNYKKKFRELYLSSSFCDIKAFAKQLSKALQNMWNEVINEYAREDVD